MTGTFCALLLFLNAFLFTVPAVAAGGERIIVTDVRLNPSGDLAEITINGCMEIKDITVMRSGGRVEAKFPEYVSRRKRVYPQVTPLTAQAREAIHEALASGRPRAEKTPATKYAITRFSPLSIKSNLKVIAAVSFNDSIEVECKVLEGRNGPWVAWPSRRTKERGRWFRQVVITDKRMKESIEQELLDRYAR